MADKTLPTAEELRSMLDYDPTSGSMRWKINPHRKKHFIGREIGSKRHNTYKIVQILGTQVAIHRAAFCLMTGRWPTAYIDHADGNKSNNAWANLREASPADNIRNSKLHRDSTSGYKGASWCKIKKKWRSCIYVDGRHINLGAYDTPEEAHAVYVAVYVEASQGIFGEFSRAS